MVGDGKSVLSSESSTYLSGINKINYDNFVRKRMGLPEEPNENVSEKIVEIGVQFNNAYELYVKDPRAKRTKYQERTIDPVTLKSSAVMRKIPDINEFREEMKCPICLDFFTKATRVSGCSHRFCSECLEKFLRVNQQYTTEEHGSNFGTGSRSNQCPECREKIASRRDAHIDYTMDALISLLSGKRSIADLEAAEEEAKAIALVNNTFKNQNKMSSTTAIATAQPSTPVHSSPKDASSTADGMDLNSFRRAHRSATIAFLKKAEEFRKANNYCTRINRDFMTADERSTGNNINTSTSPKRLSTPSLLKCQVRFRLQPFHLKKGKNNVLYRIRNGTKLQYLKDVESFFKLDDTQQLVSWVPGEALQGESIVSGALSARNSDIIENIVKNILPPRRGENDVICSTATTDTVSISKTEEQAAPEDDQSMKMEARGSLIKVRKNYSHFMAHAPLRKPFIQVEASADVKDVKEYLLSKKIADDYAYMSMITHSVVITSALIDLAKTVLTVYTILVAEYHEIQSKTSEEEMATMSVKVDMEQAAVHANSINEKIAKLEDLQREIPDGSEEHEEEQNYCSQLEHSTRGLHYIIEIVHAKMNKRKPKPPELSKKSFKSQYNLARVRSHTAYMKFDLFVQIKLPDANDKTLIPDQDVVHMLLLDDRMNLEFICKNLWHRDSCFDIYFLPRV